jgi:ZIP family zinc transporter
VLGIAAIVGLSVFGQLPVGARAATTAVAAGAILSMLVETMIPEAFEGAHNWSGLITCAGFAAAFALSMLAG